jgi:hypothetical protein
MRHDTGFCFILLIIGSLLLGVGRYDGDAPKDKENDLEPDGSPSLMRLSVSVAGSGSVSSAPGSIECGQQCEHDFTLRAQVTLTATPEVGYLLESWVGACRRRALDGIPLDHEQPGVRRDQRHPCPLRSSGRDQLRHRQPRKTSLCRHKARPSMRCRSNRWRFSTSRRSMASIFGVTTSARGVRWGFGIWAQPNRPWGRRPAIRPPPGYGAAP